MHPHCSGKTYGFAAAAYADYSAKLAAINCIRFEIKRRPASCITSSYSSTTSTRPEYAIQSNSSEGKCNCVCHMKIQRDAAPFGHLGSNQGHPHDGKRRANRHLGTCRWSSGIPLIIASSMPGSPATGHRWRPFLFRQRPLSSMRGAALPQPPVIHHSFASFRLTLHPRGSDPWSLQLL